MFGRLFVTFCVICGIVFVSGILYNHVHWALSLLAVGAGTFGVIKYRHWLFPEKE